MINVGQFILPLLPFALLGFRAWMFADLTKKDDLLRCFITITSRRNPRLDWTAAFVFRDIFTAFYYHVNMNRQRLWGLRGKPVALIGWNLENLFAIAIPGRASWPRLS